MMGRLNIEIGDMDWDGSERGLVLPLWMMNQSGFKKGQIVHCNTIEEDGVFVIVVRK